MAEKFNDLRKQIVEKNLLLESLSRDDDSQDERITQVITELDSLVYSYYKSIKNRRSNMFAC